MAINDSTKLDVLWKKVVFSTTETSEIKAGPNESVPSPIAVFNDSIYTQSDSIPKPAPLVSNSIVSVDIGSSRIQCIEDISVAGSRTWFTVSDPNNDRNYEVSAGVTNSLTDWIPPSFDPSYLVKVYAGDPQSGGVALNPLSTGSEWLFDYKAGTLFFPNQVPSGVSTNGIYIEGYRYIGATGAGGGSTEQTFQYSTQVIAPSTSEDFVLNTGNFATLTQVVVSGQCIVEAFSTIDRNDTNPYIFKAVVGHLEDDGSYVQGSTRLYGQRYAFIASGDGTGNTYWRMTNNTTGPVSISVNITSRKI